jgi:hypothetical protein
MLHPGKAKAAKPTSKNPLTELERLTELDFKEFSVSCSNSNVQKLM